MIKLHEENTTNINFNQYIICNEDLYVCSKHLKKKSLFGCAPHYSEGQVRIFHGNRCCLSSATAAITRIHRRDYLLQYLTKVVLSDGSSITVRYHEPKQIIQLPLDLSTLSEKEAKARIEKRRPKTKVKIQEEELASFSAKKYIHLVKKK